MNILLFILLLILPFYSQAEVEYTSASCKRGVFQNQYFLINTENIADVSVFFKNMAIEHFESKMFFTDLTGNQKVEETYFDDEALNLLFENQELVLIKYSKLPSYSKGKEKINFYYDLNAPPKNFNVKRYKKKTSQFDKHSFYGNVKRKERNFITTLFSKESPRLNFNQLKPKLKVIHNQVIYLIRHFDKNVARVTLDNFRINDFGLPNTTTVLEFEIDSEIVEGNLDGVELNFLHTFFCGVTEELLSKLPQLTPTNRFGYQEYYATGINILPTRAFFQKHPLAFNIIQVIVFSIVGFLVLYLLLGRYGKEQKIREISILEKDIKPKSKK